MSLLKNVLVLFDIDGTVTDTNVIDKRCFVESHKELFGFDLDNINWDEFTDVTDTGIAHEIYLKQKGRAISKTSFSKLQKLFIAKLKAATSESPASFLPVKGISDFIQELRIQNIPFAFATGGWRRSATLKLQAADIDYEGFTLATSNDASSRRSIINIAMARARFEFQREFNSVIYFGDGQWDARTCEAMEIPMICVDIKGSNTVNGPAVKKYISNFIDIEDILNSISEIVQSDD